MTYPRSPKNTKTDITIADITPPSNPSSDSTIPLVVFPMGQSLGTAPLINSQCYRQTIINPWGDSKIIVVHSWIKRSIWTYRSFKVIITITHPLTTSNNALSLIHAKPRSLRIGWKLAFAFGLVFTIETCKLSSYCSSAITIVWSFLIRVLLTQWSIFTMMAIFALSKIVRHSLLLLRLLYVVSLCVQV
jgi:hypothetical protein